MSSTPAGPSRGVKFLVSTLVSAQFFVIFTVITSAGNPAFPPSPAARDLATLTRPYAQGLFMNNPYRFYAPEPGATNMLWARFHYQDGQSRWMELPRVQDYATRVPYQRYIALMLMLGMEASQVAVASDGQEGPEALTDPGASLRWKYTPRGRICVQSFVRHLASVPEYAHAYGTGGALEDVEMYHVLHNIMQPIHAKLDRRYDDPRFYGITYVGTYTPDGNLRAGESPYVSPQSIEDVFLTRIVERDLLDFLESRKVDLANDAALEAALETFGMPLPFRWPILKNRNLLQPQGRDQLRQLLGQVLRGDEETLARQRLTPQQLQQYSGLVTPATGQAPQRAGPASTGPQKVPGRTVR